MNRLAVITAASIGSVMLIGIASAVYRTDEQRSGLAPKAIPTVEKSFIEPKFDMDWDDLIESLRLVEPQVPRTVKTERIVPQVDPEPVVQPAVVREVTPRRRKVAQDSNICVRKGLRKVMVGKYKWRCRK